MSNIQAQAAVRGAQSSLVNAGAHKTGTDALGKDDFMKLFLTQMTHQDPTSPMDSKGMMEQFAQMGTMEQMTNLNAGMTALRQVQGDVVAANAYTYLDKDVMVKGETAKMTNGKLDPLSFHMPTQGEAHIFVTDEAGNTVRTIDMDNVPAGDHTIAWDGRDEQGGLMPDGIYRFSVASKSIRGQRLDTPTFVAGKVSGIRMEQGRPFLKLNHIEVDARDVIGISNASERTFAQKAPKGLHAQPELKGPATKPTGLGG